MTVLQERPLVTFALFAYNQERYIREAVEGALAQEYTPLEIIISDDCSADLTFEIMQELVSAYDGPHAVRLIRNPVNLGLGAHVAKVHAVARGEIIVHAAGDDVSMPQRVERLVAGYLTTTPRPSLLESNAILIDEDGVGTSLYHLPRCAGRYRHENPWIHPTAGGGATYAVARSLLCAFSPLPGDFIAEDSLLGLRANLMDGVVYIPEPLVKYRVTRTGLWNGPISDGMSCQLVVHEIRWSRHKIQLAHQAIEDIASLASSGKLDHLTQVKLVRNVRKAEKEVIAWLQILEGNAMQSIWSLLRAMIFREHIGVGRWIKMFLIRWAGPIRDFAKKA